MQVIIHTKHAVNITNTERWLSVAAGTAMAVAGLARRSKSGYGMALAGVELLRRGVTGHSLFYEYLGIRMTAKGQGADTTSVPYELGVRVDDSVTVLRPRPEVYSFWRNLANLSGSMQHVERVDQIDDRRSHWVVRAPAGRKVEWDAQINNEIENELIAFRSLPGSEVDLAGSVRFKDAPGGRTEVIVELQYNPPAGVLGALAARIWGEEPTQQIHEDLRRLKRHIESAGNARTSGSRLDRVEEASEESFPASDAPAWRL